MNGVAMITVLALLEYLALGGLVGRARIKFKIEAPATTGNPEFERYFRVHQNSLEALIVFVPSLWLFQRYVSNSVAIALGLIFLAGRIIYAIGYIQQPEKRAGGAGITFITNGILVLGSLIGVAVALA
jgi:glutathione S-transferase